jgi:hypothetical protein
MNYRSLVIKFMTLSLSCIRQPIDCIWLNLSLKFRGHRPVHTLRTVMVSVVPCLLGSSVADYSIRLYSIDGALSLYQLPRIMIVISKWVCEAAFATSWSLVLSPTGCVCVWPRKQKTRRPRPDLSCYVTKQNRYVNLHKIISVLSNLANMHFQEPSFSDLL